MYFYRVNTVFLLLKAGSSRREGSSRGRVAGCSEKKKGYLLSFNIPGKREEMTKKT